MGQQNDRGTIKWTSLMLPEHVEMVKEIYKEQNKVEKPLLDEQQIQDHAFLLGMALKDNLPIEIKYHNGCDYTYAPVKVIAMNGNTKKLKFMDQNDKEEFSISFYDIFDVAIL